MNYCKTTEYMNSLFRFYLLLFLILLSCEGAEGPPGPALRGNLIGMFSLVFDQFGKPMTDKSGIEALVEGTTPEKKAITDASGRFIIEDLPTGTYNLIFSKPGFQTVKIFSLQFVGGEMPLYYSAPVLSELSTTSITSFAAEVTDENNTNPAKYTMVKFSYTITPASTQDNPRNLIAFMHTSPDVSGSMYTHQINLTNGASIIRFDKWASGTKLYAIAYVAPVSCNSYYDPSQGKYINSCLGTSSPVIEFTVP
jgi:hypothetical protein